MRRSAIAVCVAMLAIVGLAPAPVEAGLEEYAAYGVHFTAVDPVFPNTLMGYAAPGVTVNPRPHWHFDWMLAKGVAMPKPGESAVLTVQRQVDAQGREHHYVYDFYVTDLDSAMAADGRTNGPYIDNSKGECANLGSCKPEKDRL